MCIHLNMFLAVLYYKLLWACILKWTFYFIMKPSAKINIHTKFSVVYFFPVLIYICRSLISHLFTCKSRAWQAKWYILKLSKFRTSINRYIFCASAINSALIDAEWKCNLRACGNAAATLAAGCPQRHVH